MNTQTKLEKRNSRLRQLSDIEERWHRKLMRAANALDAIRKERKRLLSPRKLEPHEKQELKDGDWHKIREQDFSDEIPDFLRRL